MFASGGELSSRRDFALISAALTIPKRHNRVTKNSKRDREMVNLIPFLGVMPKEDDRRALHT